VVLFLWTTLVQVVAHTISNGEVACNLPVQAELTNPEHSGLFKAQLRLQYGKGLMSENFL
jgi:hypothetical protein